MKLPGSKSGASVGERGGLELHPCTPELAQNGWNKTKAEKQDNSTQ